MALGHNSRNSQAHVTREESLYHSGQESLRTLNCDFEVTGKNSIQGDKLSINAPENQITLQ